MMWFESLYDLYIDIATASCALTGLTAVKLKVDVSEQLRPGSWRERGVLAFGSELLTPPESPSALVHIWRIWRTLGPWAHNWQAVLLQHDVGQRSVGLKLSF